MPIQAIQTLDLPVLAPYRTMRWQQDHRDQGIFVAEGEKVVRRLLESPLEIVSLLLPGKWLSAYAELLAQRPEKDLPIFTAEKPVLENLVGFSMYQGVLAVAKVPAALSFAPAVQSAAQPRLFVAVEGVTSADNIGGLVRNCVAFGVQAMVVGETCCSPYLRRAVRSSMGTIFKLPVIETCHLVQTLGQARAFGFRTFAAHPHTDQRVIASADLAGDCLIVFGSEGEGLSRPVLEACDEAVVIPMANGVDSLNVGTAGAVFLYEAARQRGFQCTGTPGPF